MSSDPVAPPVHGEIPGGVQHRRRWSTTEKIHLVEESQQPGSSVSFVARRYGLSPGLLFSWKRRVLEGGRQAVQADEDVVVASRVRELERRVRMSNACSAARRWRSRSSVRRWSSRAQKTDLAACLLGRLDGRVAVKTVADTLGVARSHLVECLCKSTRLRRSYRKPEDAALLPTIRAIVDTRPSYGYRRVTALVSRLLRSRGEPVVNAKRVLRILKGDGLTLARYTARRPGRIQEGVVVASRSNIRWCSDHFELHCQDGAVARSTTASGSALSTRL